LLGFVGWASGRGLDARGRSTPLETVLGGRLCPACVPQRALSGCGGTAVGRQRKKPGRRSVLDRDVGGSLWESGAVCVAGWS